MNQDDFIPITPAVCKALGWYVWPLYCGHAGCKAFAAYTKKAWGNQNILRCQDHKDEKS